MASMDSDPQYRYELLYTRVDRNGKKGSTPSGWYITKLAGFPEMFEPTDVGSDGSLGAIPVEKIVTDFQYLDGPNTRINEAHDGAVNVVKTLP